MNSQPDKDADLQRLNSVADALMEHFDTVQIFATRYDSETGTVAATSGKGNWYARRGQVSEWFRKENEAERESVRHMDDE